MKIYIISFQFLISVFLFTEISAAPSLESTNVKCYAVNIENDIKNGGGLRRKRAEVAWLNDKYYGNWYTKSWNQKDNFFLVRQDNRSNNINVNTLKSACLEKFSSLGFTVAQIKVVAQTGSITPQYPIIDNDTQILISNSNVLDYNYILKFAQAADYVYSIEQGVSRNVEMPTNFIEYNRRIYSNSSSNLHAMSFISDLDRIVIISYKGSSNATDFAIDGELMAMNTVPVYGPHLAAAIIDGLTYYREILSKLAADNKNYKIILTGHSLGAFIASLVAVQTGEIARVFSSPATYINSSPNSIYSTVSNNNIPFDNVINFMRGWDPVVYASGRHVEAMVYHNSSTSMSPASSHFVTAFIEEIFKKILDPNITQKPMPTYMYIYADTIPGYGLISSANFYGKIP